MSREIAVAVPAWGSRYRRLFLGPVLRSHRAAMDALRQAFDGTIRVRYVVQTDAPMAVARALGDLELTLVPAPKPEDQRNPMRAMATAHAHAIETARENERVVLTNADMIWSREALVAVERRFRVGWKAIVCSGTRTLKPIFGAPAGLASRELHDWSMRCAHPITRSCFWGTGRCHLPWGIYFRENGATVLRAFHLHPFAIVKDRPIDFAGTIDMDLADNYRRDEIHVVTDADEMALAEVSPRSKVLGDNPWPIDVAQIASWAIRGARPTHWWNFTHRIAVQGDPARVTSDEAVAAEVMRLCPYQTT